MIGWSNAGKTVNAVAHFPTMNSTRLHDSPYIRNVSNAKRMRKIKEESDP